MFSSISNHIGNNFGDIAKILASAFSSRVAADGGVTEATDCLRTRIRDLKTRGIWDKASAVWLPHGYKEGKLYAVKGGAGADFAFTRAGTRTRKAATYLETVATGVPALDYTGSTCPSLSLEPARTNLLLQSETFDNASWTKNNTTVSANAVAGPENLTTADNLLETVANGLHEHYKTISKAASSLAYSITIFAKPINGRNFIEIASGAGANSVSKYFDVSTGTLGNSTSTGTGFVITNSSIVASANGFYRCELNITSDAATSMTIVYRCASANGTNSYVGDVTKGISYYGAQLEQASYATSYIKTEGATVSRVADAVTALTGVSDLIGQTEGTLYFEGSSFADGTAKHILSISDGTDNNRVQIYTAATNVIGGFIANAGVSQALVENTGFVTGTNYKIAFTYKSNKAALFINGVKIGEDLTVTVPACSRIATEPSGTAPFYGNGKVWAISKTAISDAEAITLTQP